MSITVNYEWPVAVPGSTTPAPSNQRPPTNIPSTVPFDTVSALLTGDGVSTTVTITHNLEITAQELTQYFPEVAYEPIVAGAPSQPSTLVRATNSVTLGFTGAVTTSSVAFGVIRIKRPHSITK